LIGTKISDVMAVAMHYFNEFVSFPGALRKSGWRYTNTFCGRNVAHRYIIYCYIHEGYRERVRYA